MRVVQAPVVRKSLGNSETLFFNEYYIKFRAGELNVLSCRLCSLAVRYSVWWKRAAKTRGSRARCLSPRLLAALGIVIAAVPLS